MNFPPNIKVAEQDVDLTHMSAGEVFIYESTMTTVATLAALSGQNRFVIGFAGPSGAGKSTFSEIMRVMLPEMLLGWRVVSLTIDAYHCSNAELIERGLKKVKGRWDTYDVPSLIKALESFRRGEEVVFPGYSRILHEPLSNVNVVPEQERVLLIVEGLWLLFDAGGWEKIRPLLDRSFYIENDLDCMRTRTVERHARGGRDPEDALRFYESSDAINTKLILQTKQFADSVVDFTSAP